MRVVEEEGGNIRGTLLRTLTGFGPPLESTGVVGVWAWWWLPMVLGRGSLRSAMSSSMELPRGWWRKALEESILRVSSGLLWIVGVDERSLLALLRSSGGVVGAVGGGGDARAVGGGSVGAIVVVVADGGELASLSVHGRG